MSSDDNNFVAPNADGIDLLSLLSLVSKAETSSGNRSRCLRFALAEDGTVADLSTEVVTVVFSFLLPKDIMRARVCIAWRDAAKKTIVPPHAFIVNDMQSYNVMRVMSTALPQLQQLKLSSLCDQKYTDGDDPLVAIAQHSANYHTLDINIISNFSKLCILELCEAPLNGRYPFLFNFPLLEQLTIVYCHTLKWDLEMLSGCPLLKGLHCENCFLSDGMNFTGNISSLRILKDTLQNVRIYSYDIRGNLMELADFPHLKELYLLGTRVIGDIRDIRTDDFPAIESLILPEGVVGGGRYEFQRISHVPVFIQAILPLLRRSPSLVEDWDGGLDWCWSLARDSPDRYDADPDDRIPTPPNLLCFVRVGPRLGWRWQGTDEQNNHNCEINWLDPKPSRESSDYETYMEELQRIELDRWHCVDFYRGYHERPTEQEYRRLLENYSPQIE